MGGSGEPTTFIADASCVGQSIADIAATHGVDIPVSCCAGACFVCAVRVTAWQEYIDACAAGEALIDTEPDELLTCVWGFAADALTSPETHRVEMTVLN